MMSENRNRIHTFFLVFPFSFFAIVLVLAPISTSALERDYWPTEKWRHSIPEAQGLDSERLLKVLPFIINNLPDIQSLLVVRNGYLVFENYYGLGMPDRQDTVHSVTKSITSALFGIAKDRGLIDNLEQRLSDILPGYFDAKTDPAKKMINLAHLLTMTAGLQPVRVQDRRLLLAWSFAPDRVTFTLDLPQTQIPGESFAYSNPISHLLSVILEKKSGIPLATFADQTLFKPLGIKPRIWKEDAQGYNTGHGGLYLSTRDMAKIGFLYLNRGYWDGNQIVSSDWIEASTQEQVRAGSEYAYGYQWWIRPVGGCHSYRAWGRNGQFVVVVPDLDLVIAVTSKTGLPGNPSGHYSPLFDIVAEAVIDKSCLTKSVNERVISGKAGLPSDLQGFLHGFSLAVKSNDIDAIMHHYSSRFLNSGRNKKATAGFYRLLTEATDEFEFRIDQCRIKGETAKIFGEIETELGPSTLSVRDLIKENGVWKWYGNQKSDMN